MLRAKFELYPHQALPGDGDSSSHILEEQPKVRDGGSLWKNQKSLFLLPAGLGQEGSGRGRARAGLFHRRAWASWPQTPDEPAVGVLMVLVVVLLLFWSSPNAASEFQSCLSDGLWTHWVV